MLSLRSTLSALLAVLVLLAAAATPALAQRDWYSNNRGYERNFGSDSDSSTSGRGRNVAGEFDYYALVLSWSPTHCSSPEGSDDELQCQRRDGRRYAFILHGLWPQYERGYPSDCRTARRPFVPQPLIDSMLDIMPSPRLVIHEYRKHGTCSGLDPAGYFTLSRRLFQSIRIPERYTNPYETQFVSPRELQRDLAAANPDLDPESIAVSCAGGTKSRLREVRICFSKDGEPRACGSNEDQRRLCSASEIAIPPVRSTKTGPDSAKDRENYSRIPLPGPRVIQGPH